MKTTVYRTENLKNSWRPCCLVDSRGAKFPEEYKEVLVFEANSLDDCENQDIKIGDVIVFGDDRYIVAPFGFEMLKMAL